MTSYKLMLIMDYKWKYTLLHLISMWISILYETWQSDLPICNAE